MNMADVKKLVERWFGERMERDSGAVTSSYEAFGDFIEWSKVQSDRGDGVVARQFGSAMKYNGFEQEHDGSYWVIRGIKLKGD